MLTGEKIMSKCTASPHDRTQQGVALIEALIAILIFSVGVLGIVGMQANMVKNTSDSKYRADASYLAQQRIGQLWIASPANRAPFIGTENISALLPGGTRTVAQSGVQYTVTVTWQQPGEPQHQFMTIATIP